jgi:peroxiredoxin
LGASARYVGESSGNRSPANSERERAASFQTVIATIPWLIMKVALFACSIVLFLSLSNQHDVFKKQEQETKAPQFELRDVSGRNVRLSDYKGKVVLINFWATWCPPCRAEMPDLIRLQREHAKQGLQIIGITYPPQTRARVRRFARSLKVNYPILLGNRQIKARFSSDETLPLTVVINRDGTVSEIISGILLREEFDQKIKPLLMKEMEGDVRNGKSDR